MASNRTIALVRHAIPGDPAADTAMSRAMLLRASEGSVTETFRLHVPGRIVAFGRRDTLEPGYAAAVAAANARGFAAVERLAGGRAAAFTEHTLGFAWTIPDPDPRPGITRRFAELAELIVGAFARLGISSAVGAIPGEYCPGRYSVHHAGRIKLMGVGQRLARHAAHVGGVVVVDGADLLRDTLAPVYTALGLDWNCATAGALADVRPGLTTQEVAAAIETELGERATLMPGTVDADTVSLAHALAPGHRPRPDAVS